MPKYAVREQATKYVVSMVPEGLGDEWSLWDIEVEWRGPGDLWAVTRFSQCLMSDGTWDWEPSPSNREDEWKKHARYPLNQALELARQWAPKVVVNGTSPLEYIKMTREWTT